MCNLWQTLNRTKQTFEMHLIKFYMIISSHFDDHHRTFSLCVTLGLQRVFFRECLKRIHIIRFSLSLSLSVSLHLVFFRSPFTCFCFPSIFFTISAIVRLDQCCIVFHSSTKILWLYFRLSKAKANEHTATKQIDGFFYSKIWSIFSYISSIFHFQCNTRTQCVQWFYFQ